MTLKLEENELLAALLTMRDLRDHWHISHDPKEWREQYQKRLREFIELNKAEMAPHNCALVGCQIVGPHEHKIEGPAEAKKKRQ